MIYSVRVTNHLNESMLLDLYHPEDSGFEVHEITGLGPAKANINTTESATNDGTSFNSSRLNSRNIVLTLGFRECPTIEDARQKSYKYFPIKQKVKLLFHTDRRTAEATGYVESNEPNIFSDKETTQVSVICPDPYFYKEGTNVTMFSGVIPLFEFPFSNESLTEPLLEMGSIVTDTQKVITYDGDASVGMVIYIHALGEVDNLVIYNSKTREKFKINTDRIEAMTGSGISAGDDLIISTVDGDNYITLRRNGIDINILNSIDRNASWFKLSKGENIFAYAAEYGTSNVQFRIENRVIYEGI